MVNRGFPVKFTPQVVEIPPLLPASTVFLKVHQHILRIFRGQVVQQLVKGPTPDQRTTIPEGFLRDRFQLCLAQRPGPFCTSCRPGRKATGRPY